MAFIRVGDTVMYRAGFGVGLRAPQSVKVVAIELCDLDAESGVPTDDSENVDAVPADLKDHCVFHLDNGHWGYGNQIDVEVDNPKPKEASHAE